MSVPFAVPTVDISAYVTGGPPHRRAAVAAAMDAACSTVGFVQVVGHGIDPGVTDALAEALDAFFLLPLEVKSRSRCGPEVNRGYSPPRSESLSLSLGVESASRMNDFFEAFNIGSTASDFPDLDLDGADYPENLWPDDAPGFRAPVQVYAAEAGRVARTLTTVFADALALDPATSRPSPATPWTWCG